MGSQQMMRRYHVPTEHQRAPNWNLEVLVLQERGKTKYPEKKSRGQRREPTTNSASHVQWLHCLFILCNSHESCGHDTILYEMTHLVAWWVKQWAKWSCQNTLIFRLLSHLPHASVRFWSSLFVGNEHLWKRKFFFLPFTLFIPVLPPIRKRPKRVSSTETSDFHLCSA